MKKHSDLGDIKFFVEGVTDVKFIRDFIFATFNRLIDESFFVTTGGYGSLFNEANVNQLQIINDNGGANLVIFDADSDFTKRRQELISKSEKYSIQINLFLFPNNEESGDRESFLQKNANPEKYSPFATCFDSYMACLMAYNSQLIMAGNTPLNNLPNRKVSIHNYLKIYGQEAIERKRNYTDSNFWDLTHEYSKPLKEFLSPYFYE